MSNSSRNNLDPERRDLLLHMYDQMFNDINRHIIVVWQPIALVVGSVGLLVAGTKEFISLDIATTLIVLLAGWLLATIYDSSYWYNRNLVIIANIERQFLRQSDLKHIHYYFGQHRSKQAMLTHLHIQWCLALGVGIISLIYHLCSQILPMCPWISSPTTDFRLWVIIPYLAAVGVFMWVSRVRRHRMESYDEFLKNSPGIPIDTTGIDYGIGHPVGKKPQNQGQESETGINQRNAQYTLLLRKHILALAPTYFFIAFMFTLATVLLDMPDWANYVCWILGVGAIIWSIIHCLVALEIGTPRMLDRLRGIIVRTIEGRGGFYSWYVTIIAFFVGFVLQLRDLPGKGLPDAYVCIFVFGFFVVFVLLGLQHRRIPRR